MAADLPTLPVALLIAGGYLTWYGVHYWRQGGWPTTPVKSVLTGKGVPAPVKTLSSQDILTADITAASATDTSSGTTGTTPSLAGGTYANPLRDIQHLVPERIDMGVDYSGTGSLHAIGPGTIISTDGSGWPGGTYILQKLTAAPYAGKYVYYAEDIHPAVKAGDNVDANTVVGQMYNGGSGIEMGWGTSQPQQTLAASLGHEATHGDPGAIPSPEGRSFSLVLAGLGAPPGIG